MKHFSIIQKEFISLYSQFNGILRIFKDQNGLQLIIVFWFMVGERNKMVSHTSLHFIHYLIIIIIIIFIIFINFIIIFIIIIIFYYFLGIKYWLCLNSWGDDFGIKGSFKIKRGEDTMGIESSAEFVDPYIVDE